MRSYKQRPPSPSGSSPGGDSRGPFDVICVGSGAGSLAAASALARFGGLRPLVLERHWTLGGLTHTFRRPGEAGGWEWDVGFHYAGELGPGEILSEALALVDDGSLRWARVEGPYDRIRIGDDEIAFEAPTSALEEALCRRFPASRRAIGAHLGFLARTRRLAGAWLADVPLPLRHRRTRGAGRSRALASRTVASVLARRLRDPLLFAFATGQWGDCGLPPGRLALHPWVSMAAHYLDGAYYPVGGAARIAESLASAIEAAGGVVLRSAEVSQILVERGRAAGVRMADGREVRARLVVSGAGTRATAALLDPEARTRALGRTLGLGPSCAHLALYLGLEGTPRELGLEGANLWAFRGPDHDAEYDRYQREPASGFPLLFASSPGAKDPTFEARSPGRSTLEIVTLAARSVFERWSDTHWQRRGAEYSDLKASLQETLLGEAERLFPRIRGRVRHAELSTPLTTRDLGGAPLGEAYGLAHDPARFSEAIRATTAVPGLFLTGQDTTTCGIAGAIVSGILTASAVTGRALLPAPR